MNRCNTTRRGLLVAGTTLAIIGRSARARAAGLSDELARIEAASGGRLGVAVFDTESGLQVAHRGAERFPMCSTFKVLAASALLGNVDAGRESLSRRIRFEARDLVAYSPITQSQVGGPGMSLTDICRAALNHSDNTAGNMMLKSIGGPAAVTSYARSVGDGVTRLDRWETALNEAVPGDPRDTTTPVAMMRNLQELVLGPALSPASRAQLANWLLGCETGQARLKAGLPVDWRIGDKTGGGSFGTTNDVGVIWRPVRGPVIVTAYLTETGASPSQCNATIASVGHAVAQMLG
jgi:beta-lactamase class A